jgi:hypothetical protein
MNAGMEAFEVIACGFRPEGSVAHFAVLVGFVLLAWWYSPSPSSTRRPAHRA